MSFCPNPLPCNVVRDHQRKLAGIPVRIDGITRDAQFDFPIPFFEPPQSVPFPGCNRFA